MSSFTDSQSLFSQYHFTVIEIDLPVVEGECTISGLDGYGTPLTCDQASNATQTLKFTTSDAPTLDESGILRIVDSINETPAKLKSQSGLASRGGGSISLVDVKGDPNPFAPAVTEEIRLGGTFLSKLDARNILTNRELRIKNYRVESDGSIDLANGAETRFYIIESFDSAGSDKWIIRIKDELSRVNLEETTFPKADFSGSLRSAINSSTTTIPVDADITYVVGDTVRIGDELMKVSGVSGIGTGSASLTVGARGADIIYTNTLSKTESDSHELGDEVFVCDVCDNEDIDVFLKRVLVAIGIDASFIPDADWAAEIALWHPTDKLNTLWIEAFDTTEVLKRVLGDYLIDMWFDPVARKVKLAAISQWKESSATISEGNEIDFGTIRRKKEENLRYTRALIAYDKRYLTKDDGIENFKKASLFKRTDLETSDFFGEAKTKRLSFSHLLDKDAADLLVNRYVSRNIFPHSYKWITQEKKRSFNVGDIVNIVSDADVGISGASSGGRRAQVMSITPKYSGVGRDYAVTALSYEPVLSDSEFIISGSVFNLNLHTYVGAPVDPVTMTIVFDGAIVGSSDTSTPAIRAGNFPVGSKLILILKGGADLQSRGGNGGRGESVSFGGAAVDGFDGGIVYDAMGIDTDIYFSGTTPSTIHPTADGFIRAPSGGDSGHLITIFGDITFSGDGGDGGDGINVGLGAIAGFAILDDTEEGNVGADGHSPPVLGINGASTGASGGLAGKGVIDSGATVVFFGDTPARYINGNGDHP